MLIPATNNLILRGSRIVSLTAFQRTCSQFCQSDCFQSTCSQIVSLTAFKGLVHTLSVLLLSKDLLPGFHHSKAYFELYKRLRTNIPSHLAQSISTLEGHQNLGITIYLSTIISQYCPVSWTSHQTHLPIGPLCSGPLILGIAPHPGALPKT
jgi:hypothetical protein